MDQISVEFEAILEKVFSTELPLVFFPIRHHSPACSFHVKKAIDIYQPDCVLIEGPSDTDSLIPCLNSAVPPVSVYYSYQDSQGRHACYYPLLDYSPELAAMRTASAQNIPVHFIDLPFGSLILGERELEARPPAAEKKTYFHDYFLQHSQYIEALCTKENCRSYSELWEKLFEIPAPRFTTETFIKNMVTLCYYSRVDYPEDLLLQEQNPAREAYMAQNILRYRKRYQRILTVTGGFHTPALLALTENGKDLTPVRPVSGNAYLIPYSFEECDQLTGYQSGMPYPGYYQSVHEQVLADDPNPFRTTTLTYISRLAKALRKNKENISLSEEAAAFAMGLGLASLRSKFQPGVYEFMDGITSAFVKGELNLATSFVLQESIKLLRGKRMGQVGPEAPVPPIVLDFETTAKSYRMDISLSVLKTLSLDIISKPRHRQQSAFLHRLCFLDNPYAQKTYGPDYEQRVNTKLVREKWDYAYGGKVISALIEKSHLGGTLEEACESQLSDLIQNSCHNSADAAVLMIKAGTMALSAHTDRLMSTVMEKIHEDHSFASLVDCLKSLSFLQGVEHLLRLHRPEKLRMAQHKAFSRAVPMIPTLTAADEKEDFALAQSLKTLYQMAVSEEAWEPLYHEALTDLLARSDVLAGSVLSARKSVPPSLDGAATGLLSISGLLLPDQVMRRAYAYFTSAGDMLALSGRFLRGLFLTAKDVIFYDDGFIAGLNQTLQALPFEDFLRLLPDLRLAFTFFSPRETDQIAHRVLNMLQISEHLPDLDLTSLPVLQENELRMMEEIDRKAMGYLEAHNYVG